MGKLVEFPLRDGGSVLVEVDDAGPSRPAGEVTRGWADHGQRAADQARQGIEQAQETFEQAVERLQPALHGLLRQMRSLPDSPDEVKLEFGLQLSAEMGAFVAKAATTGNFTVSVTWQRSSRGDAPGGS